jgi:hypothetical protein
MNEGRGEVFCFLAHTRSIGVEGNVGVKVASNTHAFCRLVWRGGGVVGDVLGLHGGGGG